MSRSLEEMLAPRNITPNLVSFFSTLLFFYSILGTLLLNTKILVMLLMLMTVCTVNLIEAGRSVLNGPNAVPILDVIDPIIVAVVAVDLAHPGDLLVADRLHVVEHPHKKLEMTVVDQEAVLEALVNDQLHPSVPLKCLIMVMMIPLYKCSFKYHSNKS